MSKRSVVGDVMAELVIYGGVVCTRRFVYHRCLADTGDARAADHFAFGVKPATPEQIARSIPQDIAERLGVWETESCPTP